MKTVIDVVKRYRGNTLNSNIDAIHFNGGFFPAVNNADAHDFVCSFSEYHSLVDELSTNYGRCDISFSEHCSNEAVRLQAKPVQAKTVEHNGSVYQVGAIYEFSNGSTWFPGRLHGLDDDGFFSATCGEYTSIREVQAPVGTITEPPIQLEDGKAYQFDLHLGRWVGLYCESENTFITRTEVIRVDRCTNIKLLTVEGE